MTTSLILGRKHKAKPDKIELIAGPMSYDDGIAEFKKLTLGDGDGFEEIFLHEIQFNGGRKRATFPAKGEKGISDPDRGEGGELLRPRPGMKRQDTDVTTEVGKATTDPGRDEAGILLNPLPDTGTPEDARNLIRNRELLDNLTIDELKEVAAEEGADITGCELKADFVQAIADHRRPLDEFTIDRLKEIADKEGIDVTECKLKKDFVETIAKHRQSATREQQ